MGGQILIDSNKLLLARDKRKHTLKRRLKLIGPWLVDHEQRLNVFEIDYKLTGHGPRPKINRPLFDTLCHNKIILA